ncbi:hypothetical protein AMR74_15510 [Halorubrum tropicale]|uniref:Uncharacterized protein n=1 Tax=Halorubrum tropicale TaxID=1765655 RepID=A0A0M9AQE2_9EURY|nr:hypothetical protein AMR74_15510 [Halorubrum tropicale]
MGGPSDGEGTEDVAVGSSDGNSHRPETLGAFFAVERDAALSDFCEFFEQRRFVADGVRRGLREAVSFEDFAHPQIRELRENSLACGSLVYVEATSDASPRVDATVAHIAVEDDCLATLFNRELGTLTRLARQFAEFVLYFCRPRYLCANVSPQIEITESEAVLITIFHDEAVFHE